MKEIDIERTEASIREVADIAEQIVVEAQTVDENGFDAANSPKIQEKQSELLSQLAQAATNVDELLSRSQYVETDGRSYLPPRDAVELTTNSDDTEVTITNTTDSVFTITVYKNETKEYNKTLGSDTPQTISVTDGDTVTVEWDSSEDLSDKIELQTLTQEPYVSIEGIDNTPEHELPKRSRTFSHTTTVGDVVY
jgi:hypothetical protein